MSLEEILIDKKKRVEQIPLLAQHDSPSVKSYTPLKEDEIEPLLRTRRIGCAGMQRNVTTSNGSPCRLFGGGPFKFLPIEEVIKNKLASSEELFNEEYDKLSAINQGYFNDGFFIGIPERFNEDKMLSILHTGDTDFNARNLIKIGANSSVKILENFVMTGKTRASHGTVIRLGENSSLNLYLLEDSATTELNYIEKTIVMQRYSRVKIHHLALPGRKSISRIRIIQEGEYAESSYYGAATGRDSEHLDLEVYSDHKTQHGRNDTSFKGILGDKSSLIFRGFIRIDERAENVESFLLANLLLLSEEAVGNALPVLEIYNGQVRAKHGETVSNISEDEMFYLMSRGLDTVQAKKAIIEGFISPVIYPLPEDISRKYLEIVEEVVNSDQRRENT
ncbi:MAG: SufD family Fe-S cluster assembly protein [Thermoplasmatales archaeon]